ncbi:MAG TPA: aspartate aminotransferase family protein [Candidatus Fimenecus excrementigallinarum]|uniref:Aspartate aminotransferase family protein n=1 Tax=Candidatus Fimenecus excrementigallinarum TaxID=2840816 RepID=A0A9D1IGY0_9FIRM|nr:aspartate aminotransferase family protein [Candidatus Fimenecus excrementigallinarum]
MTFEEIKQTADTYLMPTYAHFPVALDRGENATYFDVDGKPYIDFTAGIGVNVFGANDEGWKAAVTAQLNKLQHTSNLYYNETVARAAKLLCERSGFSKVLLCNSGAEANECAIKLARKASFDRFGEGRSTIISLQNSFHGRTIATITATGQAHYHEYFMPFLQGFRYAQAGDMALLKELAADKTVCAVLVEVIQGEGGVIALDPGYLRAVRRFCTENDLLLMADEVQTGIGRTGSLFAFQNAGIMPDVVTCAKGIGGGLPMGACLCTEALGGTLTAGTHGTTFGGNPVACAGAAEILNRIDDAFLRAVREKGAYIRDKVAGFTGVKDVHGAGLMLGVDLAEKKAADVAARCCEKGLLILTAKAALRMLPPLTITYDEIDRGLAVLAEVLAE